MNRIKSMFVIVSMCMSIFVGMVAVAPISGMVSAAQVDFISVSAGGPYDQYDGFYSIYATQTEAGAGPYTLTAPTVTIYNQTSDIIVAAAPMNSLDASLGLYIYNGSLAGFEQEVYTVVVSGTNFTSGSISATGTANFEYLEIYEKIEVLVESPIIVDVSADWYYGFNTKISAQLTKEGQAYVLDPTDELRITIWQTGGAKVDNATMTLQDASSGLYYYDFNPAFPGVWIVVVNLSVSASGTIYTGMDQLMIPYPEDPPFFPEFEVNAQWGSGLLITGQVTVNGLSYTTGPFNDARVTIWDLETGTMEVNYQLMTHHNDSVGLYNYSATGLSSSNSYLVFAEVIVNGELASGSTVTIQEDMIAIPLPSPAVDIHVEAGYIHDPWTNGLGISAIITEEGEQRQDDGSTTVRATIYHSDRSSGALTKVLDNQTIDILDGPRGMYSYVWTPAFFDTGFFHIIIEANWGGSVWYAGTTSTDVADWLGPVYMTDMKTDMILFWQYNFDDTWYSWQMFFNNYTDDLNATLANLNDTIGNISIDIDFSSFENHIVSLLNNISGNLSMIDQNLTLTRTMVTMNNLLLNNIMITLMNMDADQALIDQVLNEFHAQFKDYRNTWNNTLNQIVNDLDFQNLTVLSIESSIADFRSDFGQFWNDFNDTMASTVNDWFNTTWNKIDLFEANITAMLNSQNINFSLMESGIVGMLNDQNLNMSRIDQNITNLNTSVQQAFLNLYDNHTVMRSHISNYWAEWNITMANIQADIDWLNSTLVVVLNDIGELSATLHAFWDDFNTTWNDYDIGFAAYWQLLNLTIEGVNQTLQDDINNLAIQMTAFENNMNLLLNGISGSIANIDQNVSDMRTAMDSHFVQLWNEHNETRDLVGFYWAEWNSTLDTLIANLDYVNMTTISTNNALTVFRANFGLFWDDYNGTEAAHSTEVETWFTDTWNRLGAFEVRNAAMLEDQNDNLTDIDNQLATGFQNLYRENAMTRGHVLVYWNSWNTTRDNVQADLDFIDGELADLGDAGEARDSKLNIHTVLLIICIISAVFMMFVFRKYIVYSLKRKK